jgi:Fic family protein
MFDPVYRITPAIARSLMSIEAARTTIASLPIDGQMLASLRETARLAATHYSTQIEGNRLTQTEVQGALAGEHLPGRERDETEVRNYYRALEDVDALAASQAPIEETDVQRLHGLVVTGRPVATPYRDGQNIIREAGTGRIVYLPPEAPDVPALMTDLVQWIDRSGDLPAPIVAALAHYQFATIHPYYGGNGRNARLLTTAILHKTGYGLKGIYNLEEYYARALSSYSEALTVCPSHNYYFGRAEADVTGFVAYFCAGMVASFASVQRRAQEASSRGSTDPTVALRALDPRQRRLVPLFQDHGSATAIEIAAHLGLSHRTVTALCRKWVGDGFMILRDPSRKNRFYALAQPYG